MLRIWFGSFLLVMAVVCQPVAAQGQDQTRSKFEGFYTALGLGYRDVNTSTSSILKLNGTVIPFSISSSGPSHTPAVLTAGYQF